MGILGSLPVPEGLGSVDAALAARGIGIWQCNLADDRLTWTSGVYDLFGLPHDMAVERAYTVSLYSERSRRAMEQMRAHAIRFRRGFSLDVNIRQAGGEERWMRLSAMPIVDRGKVTHLRGLKVDVTKDYDTPAVRVASLWDDMLGRGR